MSQGFTARQVRQDRTTNKKETEASKTPKHPNGRTWPTAALTTNKFMHRTHSLFENTVDNVLRKHVTQLLGIRLSDLSPESLADGVNAFQDNMRLIAITTEPTPPLTKPTDVGAIKGTDTKDLSTLTPSRAKLTRIVDNHMAATVDKLSNRGRYPKHRGGRVFKKCRYIHSLT